MIHIRYFARIDNFVLHLFTLNISNNNANESLFCKSECVQGNFNAIDILHKNNNDDDDV